MEENINLHKDVWDYDLFDGDVKVGQYTLAVNEGQLSPRGENQIYPDSWFVTKDSEELKPSLELLAMETVANQGKGYGRQGLQKLYELSQELGLEGRLETLSAYGAGTFYEHCGMEGRHSGDDGLKYFEPTPENLAKLYKTPSAENTLTLKEVTNRNAGVELAFDEELGEFVGFALDDEAEGEALSFEDLEKLTQEQAPSKEPKLKMNFETGELEYEDRAFLEKRIQRLKDKMSNVDYLETKENIVLHGLEDIGLEGKMGKTGDSVDGTVSPANKAVAQSQIEDMKEVMQKHRQR